MRFEIIPVTPFEQNCTLLWCEETLAAAVVDPGGDLDRILAAVTRHGVHLEKILVTHGHLDHVGAVASLAAQQNLPIEGPEPSDKFWLDGMAQQCAMFGFPPTEGFTPTRWLHDGDVVTVGSLSFAVLHLPGHTPGHVAFFNAASRLAIVGDVLFQGSVGRTDFPQGNFDTLMASIHDKLLPLGDDVTFIPGHGPCSTLGYERQHNPFLRR
ncbi:MAG: MBL fold metallo-hydrolase [Azospirillaceae bacterium]|nr:MBL fold metallo-hydrolase [Azospirillaceae bacterium]